MKQHFIGLISFDKIQHFCVCAVAMFVLHYIGVYLSTPVEEMLAITLIGLAKEYGDDTGYSKFDWWDMLADILGGAFGLGICLLIDNYILL